MSEELVVAGRRCPECHSIPNLGALTPGEKFGWECSGCHHIFVVAVVPMLRFPDQYKLKWVRSATDPINRRCPECAVLCDVGEAVIGDRFGFDCDGCGAPFIVEVVPSNMSPDDPKLKWTSEKKRKVTTSDEQQ